MLTLALPFTSALAQPAKGSRFARACSGYAGQAMGEWNDEIEEDEQLLQNAGVPVSYEKFGSVVPWLLELGFQSGDAISIGFGLGRQSDSVDNFYGDATGSLATGIDVSLTTITGNLAYWVAGTHGMFLGANVGVGVGTAKSTLVFRDFADSSNDVDVDGDWSGTGLVAGVYGGYQYEFPSGFALFGRVGYQHENLGRLDGDVSSPQLGRRTGPPQNNAGRPIDTDFSGVQLMAGFGMVLGRD